MRKCLMWLPTSSPLKQNKGIWNATYKKSTPYIGSFPKSFKSGFLKALFKSGFLILILVLFMFNIGIIPEPRFVHRNSTYFFLIFWCHYHHLLILWKFFVTNLNQMKEQNCFENSFSSWNKTFLNINQWWTHSGILPGMWKLNL